VSIVIDLANSTPRKTKTSRHTTVIKYEYQPAPKIIQGRGTNEEYFWTYHGNELDSFIEKTSKNNKYEIKVYEKNGLIILEIILRSNEKSLETTLYLKNLSLSQANIKQKSKELIAQDTIQFWSNIENRITSEWSNSINPNPFNNNDIALKNLKSIKPDPYEPLHLYAELIPYQEFVWRRALSPPIYNCPTKNRPTTIMTFPHNISFKGSSKENESKVVVVTKQLPKFIVPLGTLLKPTDPSMLKT
jgi:hypothetical protein